jgi:hypothetical protein
MFTKKALAEKAREILHSNYDKTLMGDHLNFILSILKSHPDAENKIGVGVKEIFIKKNGWSYGFWIKRVDDSEIDFSYKSCISGRPKSIEQNLKQAMRNSVNDQILEFKNNQDLNGFVCGGDNCSDKIHVDHFPIKFRDLYAAFIKEKEIPTQFDDCPVTCQAIFKEQDFCFKNEWAEFHKEKATFRLLCATCNIKEG